MGDIKSLFEVKMASESNNDSRKSSRFSKMMYILSLYLLTTMMTLKTAMAQDLDDDIFDDVLEEEEPTLLDNPMFAWMDTTSFMAIWVVFSIMFGVATGGISFQLWLWSLEILKIA